MSASGRSDATGDVEGRGNMKKEKKKKPESWPVNLLFILAVISQKLEVDKHSERGGAKRASFTARLRLSAF